MSKFLIFLSIEKVFFDFLIHCKNSSHFAELQQNNIFFLFCFMDNAG